MKLRDITTQETFEEALRESSLIERLINLVPCKELQKDLRGLLGCPVDKMAEYVIASLTKSKVTNKNGSDFIRGNKKAEGKFATVFMKPQKRNGKVYSYPNASINNLKTKDCDLFVLLHNPFNDVEHLVLYEFPRDIWKSRWKSEGADITIGKKSNWTEKHKVMSWSVNGK